MKSSKKLAPALVLMALAAALSFGIGALSQSTRVMAEASANGHEQSSVQANSINSAAQNCEKREVEADEGYGISRKEVRLICH